MAARHEPSDLLVQLRDFAALLCGVFLFLYGAFEVHDPTVLAVMYGSGLTLLGLPGAWFLDARKRAES